MRDALSLADQAIAYGEGKLTGAQVAEMLGTVDRGKVLDLIAAILDDNAAEVLSLVAHIAEHAPDFVSTLDELSNAFHHMTIAQTVPDAMDRAGQIRLELLSSRHRRRSMTRSSFGRWPSRVGEKFTLLLLRGRVWR